MLLLLLNGICFIALAFTFGYMLLFTNYLVKRTKGLVMCADTPVERAKGLVMCADTPVERAKGLVSRASTPVKRAKGLVKRADTPVKRARALVKHKYALFKLKSWFYYQLITNYTLIKEVPL